MRLFRFRWMPVSHTEEVPGLPPTHVGEGHTGGPATPREQVPREGGGAGPPGSSPLLCGPQPPPPCPSDPETLQGL